MRRAAGALAAWLILLVPFVLLFAAARAQGATKWTALCDTQKTQQCMKIPRFGQPFTGAKFREGAKNESLTLVARNGPCKNNKVNDGGDADDSGCTSWWPFRQHKTDANVWFKNGQGRVFQIIAPATGGCAIAGHTGKVMYVHPSACNQGSGQLWVRRAVPSNAAASWFFNVLATNNNSFLYRLAASNTFGGVITTQSPDPSGCGTVPGTLQRISARCDWARRST